MDKIIPNIDDVEKMMIVLTVPIFLKLCKKKKIDMPNPPTPRRIMFGICVKLIFILIPKRITMAISNEPPIKDFN